MRAARLRFPVIISLEVTATSLTIIDPQPVLPFNRTGKAFEADLSTRDVTTLSAGLRSIAMLGVCSRVTPA